MGIVKKVSSKIVFNDYVKVEKLTINAYGETFERTLVNSKDAVAVLVKNTDTQTFYFVRQLRPCKITQADPTTLEVVAGLIEPGEDVRESARRECMEEIGVNIGEMAYHGASYSAPGMASEKIHYFYAEVTNNDVLGMGGGVENEHENITVVSLTEEELLIRLENHQWEDTKTVLLVQRYFLDKLSPKGLKNE